MIAIAKAIAKDMRADPDHWDSDPFETRKSFDPQVISIRTKGEVDAFIDDLDAGPEASMILINAMRELEQYKRDKHLASLRKALGIENSPSV